MLILNSTETCESANRLFESSLEKSKLFLTTYLEVLNKYNCSELVNNECREKRFQLNKFAELVFDRHCDINTLINKCSKEIGAKQKWSIAVLALEKLSK